MTVEQDAHIFGIGLFHIAGDVLFLGKGHFTIGMQHGHMALGMHHIFVLIVRNLVGM